MSTYISKLCSSAFFHLHNISRNRKFLSAVETKSLVHAFVASRVDYCNSLLYGLPAWQLSKVQRVLNSATRLVCCAPHFGHIIPLMYELHWFPLKQRIHFKILLFAFKAIHGIAPTYIQNLVSLKSQGTYDLRSSGGICQHRQHLERRSHQAIGPSRRLSPSYEKLFRVSFAIFQTCVLLRAILRRIFLSLLMVQ